MKGVLIKILVICIIAAICGVIAGIGFSLFFYGLIPDNDLLARVYLSDTEAKVRFRFWMAFAAGAIFGAVWSYRIVKSIDLK